MQVKEGVFNVQGGDVVREQHDFVGEQFTAVLARQIQRRHAAQQIDQKVARAGAGVQHRHAFGRQRCAELRLQNFFHAFAHKVDNGLRGVDDAVGVGGRRAEILKEALVDGIEEALLFGKVRDGAGRVFNREIEVVKLLQVRFAAERLGGQRGDDFFNLSGDDVAAGKLRVVEDVPKQPLGQKVLHQHFFNLARRDAGVQRRAAQVGERPKRRKEDRIVFPRLFNDLSQPVGKAWNLLAERGFGVVELFNLGRRVIEVAGQQACQRVPLGQIRLQDPLLVLVQDGPARVLKNRVAQIVPQLDFGADFGV